MRDDGTVEWTTDLDLDAPVLIFAEVIRAGSVDATQLRNALDRKQTSVGYKHRSGRWLFSHRDLFHLAVVAELTRHVAMPVGVSNDVARRLSEHLPSMIIDLLEEKISKVHIRIDTSGDPMVDYVRFDGGMVLGKSGEIVGSIREHSDLAQIRLVPGNILSRISALSQNDIARHAASEA